MSFRLAVLASGGGTTLQNLIDKISRGGLTATIRLVICSRPDAKALQRAADAQIPSAVVDAKALDVNRRSQEVFELCRKHDVDLVVMGGFLHLLEIPDDFVNRVVNIHPALIPSFCGKGFYGERVHQAAIERGVKLSGCTVHFADNQYDHGPIIVQQAVPVLEDDDPKSLAQRVFQAECEAYPKAIQLIADGRVRVAGRRVYIGAPEQHS